MNIRNKLIKLVCFAGYILYFFVILLFSVYWFRRNVFVFLLFPLAGILAYIFVPVRIFLFHPVRTVFYGIRDAFFFVVHKNYNLLDGGKLNAYTADFGGGKTLSVVHDVYDLFNRYNDVLVWDRGRHGFVTQKIHIISNVDFTRIPFEPLTSLSQVVACARHNADIDLQNGTRTVTLVVIDEASALLNSRSFKDNIDPIFLNSLLTCRHYHISIFYTTQKFNLTDKLLRDVTQRVIHCAKYWRFLVHDIYNADDVEYASNPTMVKPLKRKGIFVLDRDYSNYDTLAVVSDLKKRVDDKDMMTEAEILALRGNMEPDNESVTRKSGKLKRRQRRG